MAARKKNTPATATIPDDALSDYTESKGAAKAKPKRNSVKAKPWKSDEYVQTEEDTSVAEEIDGASNTPHADVPEAIQSIEDKPGAEAENGSAEAFENQAAEIAENQTEEVTESQGTDDSALQTGEEPSHSDSDETETFSDTEPKGADEEERNESNDVQEEPIPAAEEFPDELTEIDKEDGTGAENESEAAVLPSPVSSERALHNRTDGSAEQKNEKKKRRVIDSIFDFVELFVFTLVLVLIVTSFFVRQFVVDGDSMLNTLTNGDNLLVSDFMYDPQPGDIIVCEDYATPIHKPIVKRVIATEGQTVRITATAVYVDGAELDEPYIFTDYPGYHYDVSIAPNVFRINIEKYNTKYVEGQYYEITVPENEIFVMGDHRNNSTDSRVIGTVSEDSVVGKVLFRFYPFDVFGAVD